MSEGIKEKYLKYAQSRINEKNRRKLINKDAVIIANDCTGGFLYKYLDMEYHSPFMWLNIDSTDFITILKNFDSFMNGEIREDSEESKKQGFPVGIGHEGEKIYFRHYKTFEEAIEKWERRKGRMIREQDNNGRYIYETDHIGFMLTEGNTEKDTLIDFSNLPYRHKVAFVSDPHYEDIPGTFLVHGWSKEQGLYSTQDRWTKRRYIDQFDYVSFINSLVE